MPLDIARQQDLFNAFLNGEDSALIRLLESEKPFLFDYIFRMSGDLNLACLMSERICQNPDLWSGYRDSLTQLRFEIYRDIRSRCAEQWYDNVSELVHPTLDAILKNTSASRQKKASAFAYSRLNAATGACHIPGREAILLHIRSKLTFSEIGKLSGDSRDQVEKNYAEGLRYLKEHIPNLPKNPRQVISAMEVYPLPEKVTSETTELGRLIAGLHKRGQTTKVFRLSVFFWLISTTLLALLILISIRYYRFFLTQ
ncbi:MAG: hypothetical protein H6618_01800 [Deltaproteobacteria bacterium]|nr:hypothetical protein [Deltaproteobacteria bacterium]